MTMTMGTMTMSLIGALALLPSLVLLIEVIAGFKRSEVDDHDRLAPAEPRPRIAVLVPAHDEAAGIGATVEGLLRECAAGDRLLVVADNCSDDTAAIARAHGATVVERFDPQRRGKGYALDYGLQSLREAPPEVVIVIDADCEVRPGALDRLARQALQHDRPIQALYLMALPAGGRLSPLVAFAWVLRNQVRPLGALRLGWPCQLMGTGMALPWRRLEGVVLADGNIVEDINLGLNLARRGASPLFCPAAEVISRFPESREGQAQQRRRWEHGHLAMILAQGVPTFWQGLRQRQADLVALALDLCVPPLAFLALCSLGVGLLATGGWLLGWVSVLPVVLALLALGAIAAAVVLAWLSAGRGVVSGGDLLRAPLYALKKIPLYLGFMRQRQTEWVRSDRS